MTGFGNALREQREQRGLSLQTLSEQTKVSVRQLEALEAEDFEALPRGVFRKGIVRAYLKAAGLEESHWFPRFEASHQAATGSSPDPATNPEAWAEFAENVRRGRPNLKHSHGLRWVGVLLMLAALVAAAWAVWHYILRFRLNS